MIGTQERVTRVLASQGYPAGHSFPADLQAKLSVLCDEYGVITQNGSREAKRIITDYHDSLKAAVDPPAEVEQEPAEDPTEIEEQE